MSTDYYAWNYRGSIESIPYAQAEKDPDSEQNFVLNWAVELNGETISTSTWEMDGLTNEADSNTDYTATVRASGGTRGSRSQLHNTITTSGGQRFRKSLTIVVREL